MVVRHKAPLLIRRGDEAGTCFEKVVTILPHPFIQPVSFVDDIVLASMVEIPHTVQSFHYPFILSPLVNLGFRRCSSGELIRRNVGEISDVEGAMYAPRARHFELKGDVGDLSDDFERPNPPTREFG